MKKTLFILTSLLLCAITSLAQTILVDNFTPIESEGYRAYPSKGDNPLKISGFKIESGFRLSAPQSSLIGNNKSATAIFNLKGAYSKMTFVLGPAFTNSAADKYNAIVTITGDGKRLVDEVVFDHDALRYFTLDVTGVNELKFYLPKGSQDIGFGNVKLWKSGQNATQTANPLDKLPNGKVKMVEQLQPYFIRHSGWVNTIGKEPVNGGPSNVEKISINRKEYFSGLQFTANEGFSDEKAWSYFWLNKRFDKISFIVGPRDNQSSNASAWLVVKADKKIIYEGVVTQKDLAQQIVLDVKGAEQVSFISERRSSDFLGSITFGVVEMYAYRSGDNSVPTPGVINANKDLIAKLPNVCPLLSNIRPFSVRGMSSADNTLFYGESRHYTFSMGGQHFWEGLLLTTGNSLLEDRIDSYAEFDLAGEYDWISFQAGCLSKKHTMDDDRLRIWADNELVLDTIIHCTWPNQYFEIPIHKCRTLRFEKPGNGKKQQTIIGVGDIVIYRGKPVANDIFEHDIPDCPYEADLIDLCESPYFHFVGRYSSSLTNFSMDNCFHNGESQRNFFQMKDGSKIYKGFMLETNIPLGLENVTVMDAVFMFITGAGASISSSGVAAATGTSAGVSSPGAIGLLLSDPNNKQSSAIAFNPYGEYESCTFTVANMNEYVDAVEATFGATTAPPVKLNVFADQVLVGEYWLDNKMQPTTITVPIFKCHQLMFWLECGDYRSGQYVFYDLKVSKAPCNVNIPTQYTPSVSPSKTSTPNNSKAPVKHVTPSKQDNKDGEKTRPVKNKDPKKTEENLQKAAKAAGTAIQILNSILN